MILRKCILLIDDDEDFTHIAKFIFEQDANWKVLTASNGKEGIAIAESEQPDVILLDVVMPELDGFAVYKLLKNNLFTCTIPIVFVSARAFIVEIVKSQISENVLVITKPFDLFALPERLNELCSEGTVVR